jgi:hypothetical protein
VDLSRRVVPLDVADTCLNGDGEVVSLAGGVVFVAGNRARYSCILGNFPVAGRDVTLVGVDHAVVDEGVHVAG